MTGLTVLSYGGGQDSTAILYKLFLDPEWKARYVHGDLLIIMSDTGCEHPETYSYVEHIKAFVESQGGNFIFLQPKMGYHSAPWRDLRYQWRLHNSIGSKAYPKTCTTNLKVVPIYRFLDEYVAKNYMGWPDYKYSTGRKRAIKEYAARDGKIRVIIGIAKGEEKRVAKPGMSPVWMENNIEKVYPLITEGVDRFKAIDIIKGYNQPVPLPSNCMMCPFANETELLWLSRFYPDVYKEWVVLEANKIAAYKDKTPPEKNFGVFGRRTLPEVLEQAKAKYGTMTDKELQDHKMVHGHSNLSAY